MTDDTQVETTGKTKPFHAKANVFAEMPDTARPVSGWWGWLWALIFLVLGNIIASIIAVFISMPFLEENGWSFDDLTSGEPTEFMGFFMAISLPLTFVFALIFTLIKIKTERRSFATAGFSGFLYGGKFWGAWIGGLVLALIVLAPTFLIGDIWGVMPENEPDWSRLNTTAFMITMALLFLALLVQAPTEEIMFRGWLFSGIGAKHGFMPAVLLSSVFFGFAHGDRVFMSVPIGIYYIILTACIGYMLAGISRATGSVTAASGIHTGYNFALMSSSLGYAIATSDDPNIFLSIASIFDLSDLDFPAIDAAFLFDAGVRIFVPIAIGIWFLNRSKKA
ncbi:MAG: CPBP family intramembrane metalloprotease [Aquisalinus sp.]|nr:CPBP family intramembrane metalloprotease [Aquisalinus sp.]